MNLVCFIHNKYIIQKYETILSISEKSNKKTTNFEPYYFNSNNYFHWLNNNNFPNSSNIDYVTIIKNKKYLLYFFSLL